MQRQTPCMLGRLSWRSAWCYSSEQLWSLLVWDYNSLKMFGCLLETIAVLKRTNLSVRQLWQFSLKSKGLFRSNHMIGPGTIIFAG